MKSVLIASLTAFSIPLHLSALTLNGAIPADTAENYPAFQSLSATMTEALSQSTWLHCTAGGININGLTAINGENPCHVKISHGSALTAANCWNSTVGGSGAIIWFNSPSATAASIWLYNGRVILQNLTAGNLNPFANVPTVYVAGAQLSFNTENIAIGSTKLVVTPALRWTGDTANNYKNAAFRVNSTTTLGGELSLQPLPGYAATNPVIFTFQNKTLTVNGALTGSADLKVLGFSNTSGSTLALNAISGYTGNLLLEGENVTVATGAVTGSLGVKLNHAKATFKPLNRLILASGSTFTSGTINLTGMALSETDAALTLADDSITFNSAATIAIDKTQLGNLTRACIIGIPAGASEAYRAALIGSVTILIEGRVSLLDSEGCITIPIEYPDVRTAGTFGTAITDATQNLWLNVENHGGDIAGLSASGLHVKVTSGGITDTTNPTTYTPSNGNSKNIKGNITAESLWLASGRLIINTASSYLNGVRTLNIEGGQLYPLEEGGTLTPNLIFGTSAYSESGFAGTSLRIDRTLTFSGTTTLIADNTFSNNGADKTLTIKTLAGFGNLTFNKNTSGTKLVIEDPSAYTGTLKLDKSNLTTAIGSATLPKINLSAGTLAATASQPPTLATTSSFTGGTLDLSAITLTEGATLFSLPEGAAATIGSGTTLIATASDDTAFPFTAKINSGAGANLAWNQPAVVLGIYPVTHALTGGTLTFDLIRDAAAFTPPSPYWEEKTKPTQTIRIHPPASGAIDFLGNGTVRQEIGGKTSVTISLASGGSTATDLFGLHSPGKGTRDTVENDIWIAVNGGTLRTLVGASDNNWTSNQATSLHGDILIDATAGTITDIVGGYLNAGCSDTLDFRGNIGITLQGTARLNGTLVAASTSGHSQHPRHIGDTAILITTLQPANNTAATSHDLPPGFIIGGQARTNSSGGNGSGTLTGNSAITLAIGEGSGSFVKTLVGGSHSEGGTGTLTFIGDTAIDISAPAAITFTAPIYGGGYAKTATQSAPLTGNTSITLRGGTYTSTITPAGLNAPVSGNATLTLKGGTYTGATLAGTQGSTTGGSTLAIDAPIDLTAATVTGFNAITLSPAATLTLGETSGIGTLTLASGATLALDTPASAQTLTLAEGAILAKTDAQGSILTITGAITPPESGRTAITIETIPGIGEKIYLIIGEGAAAAQTASFIAPEKCMVRSDSTGIYLIRKQGILISIH